MIQKNLNSFAHCVYFLFHTYSSSPDSPPPADSAKSVGSAKPVHSAKPTAKKAKKDKTKAASKKPETQQKAASDGVVRSTNIFKHLIMTVLINCNDRYAYVVLSNKLRILYNVSKRVNKVGFSLCKMYEQLS